MDEHIAFVIKIVRKNNRLTQAELAEELGVTSGHIGSLEQGRAKPSYDIMRGITEKFGIDANLFFGRTQKDAKSVYENVVQLTENLLSEVRDQLGAFDQSVKDLSSEDAE